MSSEQAMRGILQTRLLTLSWSISQTAVEGKQFTPAAGTPYQELETAFATPIDATIAGSSQLGGTFQVRVMWPLTTTDGTGAAQIGIGAATARAEAIKAGFPRNLKLTTGGQTVKIMKTPSITRSPPQGDRDVTIVRIRFSDR